MQGILAPSGFLPVPAQKIHFFSGSSSSTCPVPSQTRQCAMGESKSKGSFPVPLQNAHLMIFNMMFPVWKFRKVIGCEWWVKFFQSQAVMNKPQSYFCCNQISTIANKIYIAIGPYQRPGFYSTITKQYWFRYPKCHLPWTFNSFILPALALGNKCSQFSIPFLHPEGF